MDELSEHYASYTDEEIRIIAYSMPEDSPFVKELMRRGLPPIPRVARDVDRVDIAEIPTDTDPNVFGTDELGFDAEGNFVDVPYSKRPFARILVEARSGDEQAGEELVLRAPFTYTKDGQLTEIGQQTMRDLGMA